MRGHGTTSSGSTERFAGRGDGRPAAGKGRADLATAGGHDPEPRAVVPEHVVSLNRDASFPRESDSVSSYSGCGSNGDEQLLPDVGAIGLRRASD